MLTMSSLAALNVAVIGHWNGHGANFVVTSGTVGCHNENL